MKHLIISLLLIFSVFTQAQIDQSDEYGYIASTKYAGMEGNILDFYHRDFLTFDAKFLNVLGGRFILSQTGQGVQDILNGDFGSSDLQSDSLIISGGGIFGGKVIIRTSGGTSQQGMQIFSENYPYDEVGFLFYLYFTHFAVNL